MKKIVLAILIFLLLFSVPMAFAQFGRGPRMQFHSEFKPVVGGWSEYEMKGSGGSPTKMKIAIVGKEGDAYWYETSMEDKQAGKMVSKMLVSGNPDERKNVKRIIIKSGDQPAMEMPVQTPRQSPRSEESAKGKLVEKGTEAIKVPAGAFTTKHFQYQDANGVTDTWIYKDIHPYGLIKSQSKDFEMVLLAYGTGAQTQITETPRKFEMPKMPRGKPRTDPPSKEEDDE
jgi:hypothetical protein